jgi:multiple sugar transport system substrate-binding protein
MPRRERHCDRIDGDARPFACAHMEDQRMKRRTFCTLATAGSASLALGARPARAATTVSLWHIFGYSTEPGLINIARFNQTRTDVQIDGKSVPFGQLSQQLVKAVATGDVPDLITIDNPTVASFAGQGVLEEVGARVAASKGLAKSRFFPGSWATTILQGKQFAVPGEVNTLMFYVNQDMLRAGGVDLGKPPQTWAELTATAAKLADSAKGKYGIGVSAIQTEEGTFQWLPFLQQSGAGLKTLTSPDAVAALQLWVDWVQKGYASRDILVKRQSEMTDAWLAGNSAMSLSGPWELPRILRDVKFNWTVIPMPVREGKNIHATALGGYVWAIPKGAKNIDAAFQVIEYMLAPEQAARSFAGGRLPAVQDVQPPADLPRAEVYAGFESQLQYARPRGPSPEWPRISEALQRAIQQAITGQQPAQQALATAEATIAPLLQRYPIEGM